LSRIFQTAVTDIRKRMSLIRIDNLKTYFQTPQGVARAVDSVSLEMQESDVLGIVGESGCGKSVLALSILLLLPVPPAMFAGGSIFFSGVNLLSLSQDDIRKIRGNQISMIFQEPMTALNPVFSVGNQLAEVYRTHWGISYSKALTKAVE